MCIQILGGLSQGNVTTLIIVVQLPYIEISLLLGFYTYVFMTIFNLSDTDIMGNMGKDSGS